MIIFHEGLGGSGKSYEAIVKHAIPALKEGRAVWSNVNGLREGAAQIAGLIDKTFEETLALIHFFPDEDVRQMHEFIPKDVLVIVDEVQDFYPSDLRTISQEERKFVTRQRHEGLDIILMGQNFNDVNKLWRNRTQRKIIFTKRTAIGQPDKYTWQAYEGRSNEDGIEFIKINSGGGEYEEKYFGTYKSHTDDTENKAKNYNDDRANLLKRKSIIFGVPAVFIMGIFAVSYLYSFMTKPSFASTTIEQATLKPAPQLQPKMTQISTLENKPVTQEKPKEYIAIDYLDELANRNNLRLSAALYSPGHNEITFAIIDIYDATHHLKERFSLADVKSLGWEITLQEYGLDIEKENKKYVVRPYPLGDLYGRINQSKLDSL